MTRPADLRSREADEDDLAAPVRMLADDALGRAAGLEATREGLERTAG